MIIIINTHNPLFLLNPMIRLVINDRISAWFFSERSIFGEELFIRRDKYKEKPQSMFYITKLRGKCQSFHCYSNKAATMILMDFLI
jgi:hypothetical protein